MSRRIERIISGGQTGVDRAALDAALARGLPIGGWCPRGRKAEDGELPARYALSQTPSGGYRQRTLWNVRDSDATLLLVMTGGILISEPSGGTRVTANAAVRLRKPHFIASVNTCGGNAGLLYWLAATQPRVLNVAGPRESGAPGIYSLAHALLLDVFDALQG